MARTEPETLQVTPEDGSDYAEVEIPEGLASRASALADVDEPPETLGDVVDVHEDTAAFVPEGFTWRDMLVAEDSRHEVRVGDERYHTYCVLDALVLPFLLDDEVEIRSEPPAGGSTVEIAATAEKLEARPATAIVSFGLSLDVPESAGSLDSGDPEGLLDLVHAEGCPRINAFPDRSAYEAWAAEVDAATVGVTLAQAYAMARDSASVLPGPD